jgi:tetratricopeptide (TPR) repeat protein
MSFSLSSSTAFADEAAQSLRDGQWEKAAALAERLLASDHRNASAHYIAGLANLELKRLSRALAHLHMASQSAPRRLDIGASYARALASVRLSRDALAEADRVMAQQPSEPGALDELGMAYTLCNAHAQAREAFARALALRPDHAHLLYNHGTSLMFTGDLDAAEAALERCVSLAPHYWRAHATLAQLRRQTPTKNHVSRLRSLLAEHPDEPQAQELLRAALSKELEDLGRIDEAFDELLQAKAVVKARLGYDAATDAATFQSLREFAPGPVQDGKGHQDDRPIFVIGMPRTGTTLVERILSSHPRVHSAGELQQFGMALKRASGSTTVTLLDPDTIRRSANLDWSALGEAYMEATRAVAGEKPHFVDKLPHNFLYAAHIARALPRAKIVCVRRHPMDTCLSNFRQSFGEGSPFHGYALELLDIGRYYLQFNRLMREWQERWPCRILEVSYEGLVDEQEQTTRALLAFCGLDWDPRCLAFELNEAPVATASAVQVRSGIYRSSKGRWRQLPQRLAALRDLLVAGGLEIEPFDSPAPG